MKSKSKSQKTFLEESLGGEIILHPKTDQRNKTQEISYNGSFEDPGYKLGQSMREVINNARYTGKVRSIDPRTIKIKELSGLDLKRARALALCKRYFSFNSFIRHIRLIGTKRPLTEKQCDTVISVCEQIKEQEEKAGL